MSQEKYNGLGRETKRGRVGLTDDGKSEARDGLNYLPAAFDQGTIAGKQEGGYNTSHRGANLVVLAGCSS
jgi:hypothetical protein